MDIMKLFSLRAENSEEIHKKWLSFHYWIHLGMFFAAVVTEVSMYFALRSTDSLSVSPKQYFIKYAILPSLVNLCCLFGSRFALKSRGCPERVRPFVLSLCLLFSCCILYTVHSVFSSLILIFALPVLLTLIYGDYALTITLSAASLFLRIVSDCFFFWDPDRLSLWENQTSFSNFVLSVFLLAGLYIAILIITYFERIKNQIILRETLEKERLFQESRLDGLTKLYNRMALNERLSLLENTRHAEACILAMIDFDHFKAINDTYGHPIGDAYLKLAGEILRTASPKAEAYRYGGDEFCLLFMDADIDEAIDSCILLQERMAASTPLVSSVIPTFSIGLALCHEGMTPEALLHLADAALYQAKESSRGSIKVLP